MIDCQTFSEARPSHQPYLIPSEKVFRVDLGHHLEMTDEEYMICADAVAGYSFDEKKWGWFNIVRIRDIQFDRNAFSSLILDEDQKKTILSLISSYGEDDAMTFDDIIRGKGQGLVILLHGEPGTGKTLTAGAY
jgi:hypothetical protein